MTLFYIETLLLTCVAEKFYQIFASSPHEDTVFADGGLADVRNIRVSDALQNHVPYQSENLIWSHGLKLISTLSMFPLGDTNLNSEEGELSMRSMVIPSRISLGP